MKMKKLLSFLLLCALVLSLAACGSSSGSATTDSAAQSSDDELEEFSIVLDWYPNAVHAFIYVAIEKGYYEEEGLNVQVQFPANTNDAITMTAAGQADAGLYYQPNIITTAVNQDIPIKILGTVVQHPLNIVMSMTESGIESPADLAGKTIGYPGTTDNEYYVQAMMESCGLSYEDTEMIDVGFDLNAALITNNVDAVIGAYINHEYTTLLQDGYDVTYFDVTDYGVPDYEELVLITGESQIEESSEKLAAFIRASRKAYQDVIDDPEASLQILLDNQDEANYPLDADVETASMEILLPLMAEDSDSFLQINEDSWLETAAWLYEMNVIEKEADINELVANID